MSHLNEMSCNLSPEDDIVDIILVTIQLYQDNLSFSMVEHLTISNVFFDNISIHNRYICDIYK